MTISIYAFGQNSRQSDIAQANKTSIDYDTAKKTVNIFNNYNQQNGIAAINATINYFSTDTVPDSTNITAIIFDLNGVKYLAVAPRSGIWMRPFIACSDEEIITLQQR